MIERIFLYIFMLRMILCVYIIQFFCNKWNTNICCNYCSQLTSSAC